ncbi:MAG: hypothetical protein E7L01_14610 [Paenibacillus macerans]|uniref:YgiT-type zinc finger protein n=2 Tax=Paenibacillus macerans TaxID=44252 RepID=A0A6N8EUY5_PAEMA|nr:hypothetical protein [Paenibacillus macerans]MBS5911699.1 hypothetical protein [Paenibacillus macerans]MDU7474540.1 hypothetical protein [Paenibacillus macerans]MEC0140059.1 hypothetical protein [Paenibacillus macerans]MUG22550.1 hypothetical protein [Paenibacillus macerans]GBK64232.1 hypothetical protein PbDSM24746_42360 [Paenibacillus macerans]
MRKHCHCGQMMNLGFRVVIFEGIYEISRVPIYECEDCSYYEVLPEVKTDLTDMLAKLKRERAEERIDFTERNELADLIFGIYRQWNRMETSSFEALLERQCEERINLLLDLFGCAKNLGDTAWMDDISQRLAQLSKFIKNRQLS